jgi:hypothetical protein
MILRNWFGLRPQIAIGSRALGRLAIVLTLFPCCTAMTRSQPSSAISAERPNKPERRILSRDREMSLALSSCPEPIAAGAAVYLLGDKGYVRVRESTNGFTAIVQHALPTSQEPQCMDAEGTQTILPRILKVAELRAQGKTAAEIREYVAGAYAKGIFRAPAKPGIDYMLSTEIETPNEKGEVVHFPPHVMFYAPYLTNADIGSRGQGSNDPAFVVGEGSPHAIIIVPLLEPGVNRSTAPEP